MPDVPTKTGDADKEEGKVKEPDEDAVREASEAAKKFLDKQDSTDKKTAIADYIKAEIKVAKSTIKDSMTEEEEKVFDEQITNGMENLIGSSLDDNGMLDYSKLKKKFFDDNNKLKLPDEFNQGSPDADNLADKLNKTFAKALLQQVEKFFPEGRNAIDKTNTIAYGAGSDAATLNEVEDNNNNAASATPQEAERRHQANKADEVVKELEKNPDAKDKNTWSLKDIVKLAGMLLSGLKLLGLVWFLVNYALTHTGCMLLSCEKGDVYPTSQKAACYISAHNQEKTIKMLNPTSGILDFSSDRCNCSNSIKQHASGTCDGDTCKNPEMNNLAPWSDGCQQAGQRCSTDITSGCPLKYYSYKLFNPFQFFNDAGSNAANAAARGSAAIVKYMIIAGIICGVLLVLYIIYKYVASRKPAEAIKIETDSSKFGNILGNLNKFSRYYMRPISYAPVKFGNRFNF